MKFNPYHLIIIISVFLIALMFRLNGVNWDAGHHLHPDERFLTMVANAMEVSFLERVPVEDSFAPEPQSRLIIHWDRIPSFISSYFNQKESHLNPVNIGYEFFVYGTFPLVLTKCIAIFLNMDNYGDFTILGRILSALCDVGVIFFICKICSLLHFSRFMKYSAGLLYALAVFPIQLSHFFAVDTFLNLFVMASVYFALRFALTHPFVRHDIPFRKWVNPAISAVFFGLALGSKVSAVFALPLLGMVFLVPFILKIVEKMHKISGVRMIAHMGAIAGVFVFCTYITLRIANPYYFESAYFLDPQPAASFVQNIKQLKSFEGEDVWYPPAIQWIHKPPVTFSLVNLVVFGVGVPYFLVVLVGMVIIVYQVVRKIVSRSHIAQVRSVQWVLLIILIWVIGFFLYQSTQFVKVMRYFIVLYPFLAIFGAIGLDKMNDHISTLLHHGLITLSHNQNKKEQNGQQIQISRFVLGLLILTIALWPLMFASIYMKPHTRVVASKWMYEHLPDGSFILSEHWDDPLPLLLPGETKILQGEQLPVFGMDTPEKWQQMDMLLQKGDYYVLSSNRAWGSIPGVPEKYPLMTEFYNDLFDEKVGYTKVAEFTSYPSLEYLGIPLTFPDQWADESFTVYDHPKVMIYEKVRSN